MFRQINFCLLSINSVFFLDLEEDRIKSVETLAFLDSYSYAMN